MRAAARLLPRVVACRAFALALAVGAAVVLPAARAEAQAVKSRFVFIIDTSGSMLETADSVRTHGDGSKMHLGCDLDSNGKYDDSKLFQAKAALNDTIAAFGAAEFALGRYHQDELGQACMNATDCLRMNRGANTCEGGFCAFNVPANSPNYDECSGGTASTNGCFRCADPDNDPTHVWYYGGVCCPAGGPRPGGFGVAGDVVVAFPNGSQSNVSDLFMWMDGEEDFPKGMNKELRGSGTTPIGGSLNAVRDWLTNDKSTVGPSPGIMNRDDKVDCRSYNVILITDGIEIQNCVNSCGIDAVRAADLLLHGCTNGGAWDTLDRRCEINGDPAGTREVRVRTWVVGYAVDDPRLNTIAAAGGTGVAVLARNQAELTARLGDIISGSLPSEKCDCRDNTCDGAVDETFTSKGQECTVGVGRCKRRGRLGCKADGTGVVCSADAPAMCPVSELVPGAPAAETCGVAPGCEAPTPEDCADDDCDGQVDENMSCACASKPELCNGLDDDCNGKIDDLPPTRCGPDIGECRAGQVMCIDDGAGGRKSACMGGTEPQPERCDSKDNDCDGIVDGFGLGCFPAGAAGCALKGDMQACGGAPADRFTCQGVCRPGIVTCADGRCGDCRGAVTPSTEVACDALDNDCDGETDEGFGLGGACGAGMSGVGPCKAGVLMCVDGVAKCVGGVQPKEETCNGIDDDCDGQVDNLPGTCGIVRGECRPGRWRCEGEALVCDQPQGPKPEVCDGKDNDCDGQIDDDPTDPQLLQSTPCGSTIGACRPGIMKCVGGGLYCDGGVEAVLEVCNGQDDDCDGQVDEGINPPGPCPPPGLPLGATVRGECRPGANTCLPGAGGAAWACVGGVGPEAELCDGKDNDCDGEVDEAAPCPDGEGCGDGECVPRCRVGTDVECPSGRICRDGLCRFAECVLKPCPAGFRCDLRRGCVDRCEGVSCPEGTECRAGECVGCLLEGCPTGQVCREAGCVPHPCASVKCAAGSYCRDGKCVKTCTGVSCRAGEVCRDGACVANPCTGKKCAAGEICDRADGRCKPNPCPGVQCLPGQVCLPSTGACTLDPCAVTTCGPGDACVVGPTAEAECRPAKSLIEVGRVAVSGGGGCGACAVGATGTRRPESLPIALCIAVVALALRARRRRR